MITKPRSEVQQALDYWEPWILPTPSQQVAVLLEQTLAMFAMPEKLNWGDVSQFYFEAVEDVPIDLALEALKHVRLNCKFWPLPAELRNPIIKELNTRKSAVGALRFMLSHGDFLRGTPTGGACNPKGLDFSARGNGEDVPT